MPPPNHANTAVWDGVKGVFRHIVSGPYLRGPSPVEILLPDRYGEEDAYTVLYVLPCEAGIGGKYGDGLEVIRAADLHNQHRLIAVSPAFDTLPWYGAHATDPTIRHEEHLRRVVVPFVEANYTTAKCPAGRLVLGFSKSGWGAFTLLLRNPDFFGYACSWDAPLMMEARHFGHFGTGEHFGSPENFAHYLPSRLFETQGRHFAQGARFVLLGSMSFGPEPQKQFKDHPHTLSAHHAMTGAGIGHVYSDDLHVPHHWEGGWVVPAVDRLIRLVRSGGVTEAT